MADYSLTVDDILGLVLGMDPSGRVSSSVQMRTAPNLNVENEEERRQRRFESLKRSSRGMNNALLEVALQEIPQHERQTLANERRRIDETRNNQKLRKKFEDQGRSHTHTTTQSRERESVNFERQKRRLWEEANGRAARGESRVLNLRSSKKVWAP